MTSQPSYLQLAHARVIDTAVMFGHVRGPGFKSSLRHLAAIHLQRDIQDGSHDRLPMIMLMLRMSCSLGCESVEDARACMDLVKLKLLRGSLR